MSPLEAVSFKGGVFAHVAGWSADWPAGWCPFPFPPPGFFFGFGFGAGGSSDDPVALDDPKTSFRLVCKTSTSFMKAGAVVVQAGAQRGENGRFVPVAV